MNFTDVIREVTADFNHTLQDLVRGVRKDDLTPESFSALVEGLKGAANEAGLKALVGIVSKFEETAEVVEHGGQRHRFKQPSEKEWLTAFGVARLTRRYYQPDAGGKGVVPLDVRCGMVDRFATPDVEELMALASSNLVPKEVETLLGKALPHGPSATAVQRVLRDVGGFAEAHDDAIEAVMNVEAPLTSDGDVCVISWDGVNVPLREAGVKTGRPPERPGVRESRVTPTAWKEAGVGCISIYASPIEEDDEPIRLDKRYFARMPESGMARLLAQQEAAVCDLFERRRRPFRAVAVICDGKRPIWEAVRNRSTYDGAVEILDFYHATEHLSKAAEAVFGKASHEAKAWFDRYRTRMRDEVGGTNATIRSLRYHRKRLRARTEAHKIVTNVIRFFSRNRHRMSYATFRARGLPIGSGPVEAACKTLVGARLKRSGMRWSREGGQHVLNLRRHEKAERWDTFWNYYLKARAKSAA
jgi:hypothetical protein